MVSIPAAVVPEPIAKASSAPRRMNPTEIEFALQDLVSKPYDAETFPYDLFAIFNASKVTVSRLKSGTTNKATQRGDVLWQKQFFFRPAQPGDDVGAVADALMAEPLTARHKPRFILVTNGQQVHIRDLKFDETCNVKYESLDEQSYFLRPLAGYERRAIVEEHPADIKAAKKLKKLYDAILAANPTWNSGHHSHELNLLMTRLLFCFYAEKTGIFEITRIFTNTLTDFSGEDGTEVAPLLDRLFRNMNVEEASRPNTTPASETRFPYVNGSLFEDTVEIPSFNRTARRQLLECGDLDWTTINPDIFGSMIQTIAQDGTRSDLGMHYTSVSNVTRLLGPLFLDELKETYEKSKDSVSKLESLLSRLSRIRVFDPACGSGNFLIVAYKALRELEHLVLVRIIEISPQSPLRFSGISIQRFYGIDVVDFACETTKLSLWIAEHQMNSAYQRLFGKTRPVLPLAKIETIHRGNALRLDWLDVCPPEEHAETFICGNPPYQGGKTQSAAQKEDVALVFGPFSAKYKDADYIACWFIKAGQYITDIPSCSAAFVSTNSITQGLQVPLLWTALFRLELKIVFGYPSFKWQNNASHNAFVYCVIVGIAMPGQHQARLFFDDHTLAVENITPYLTPGSDLIVRPSRLPINNLPSLRLGNIARDDGNLVLTSEDRRLLLREDPNANTFIHRYFGSDDINNGLERWCLWIGDDDVGEALEIPPIARRVRKVEAYRKASPRKQTRELALAPYKFAEIRQPQTEVIAIPSIFSEKRRYLTPTVLAARDIITNSVFTVPSSSTHVFALVCSKLHHLWSHTLSGRHGLVVNYSNIYVYNTFPVPTLSADQRAVLSRLAASILQARARHPGKSLAWLYDDDTMPPELRTVHEENDSFIETVLYGRKFNDDNGRLAHLFFMYEQSIRNQQPLEALFSTNGDEVELIDA